MFWYQLGYLFGLIVGKWFSSDVRYRLMFLGFVLIATPVQYTMDFFERLM